MPAEKATALVLRVIDFSESSCVVTLFTREFGKIGALAKGGRRPKGPFEAALDLLATCRVVFLRKSSDALDLLTEAKLERRFRPPGHSLSALYAGYAIAELLNELTDQYDPHPRLFDWCTGALARLAAGEDPGSVLLSFELGTLDTLGHGPALDYCAECGVQMAEHTRFTFGLVDGGVLCERCRRGKRHLVLLSRKAWEILSAARRQQAGPGQLPTDGRGEARSIMNRYLTHLVGRPLKMHAFLGAN